MRRSLILGMVLALAVTSVAIAAPGVFSGKSKQGLGVSLGHLWDRMDLLRREMLALLADYEAGRIRPVVGKTFPLVEAAAAHRYIQERQNVGKVVLTVV